MKTTRINIMKRLVFAAVLLAFAVALGACASSPYKKVWDLSEERKEALLRERVTEVWAAQVSGDRESMYDYYDPFFRARVSKGFFAGKKIPVFYSNPSIIAVQMRGNVARVRVGVTFEIKGLTGRFGQSLDREPEKKITDETWLFLDRTWHRQYIDYISDSSFAKY